MRLGLAAPALVCAFASSSLAHARARPVFALPSPGDVAALTDALATWSPASFADALATEDASAASCTVGEGVWSCDTMRWSYRHPVLGEVDVEAARMTWAGEAEATWSEVTVAPRRGWSVTSERVTFAGGRVVLEGARFRARAGRDDVRFVECVEEDGAWEATALEWDGASGTARARSARSSARGGWEVSGMGALSVVDTSTRHVGGVLAPTVRYADVVEVEGVAVLGDTGLALSGWAAPSSHYGAGLTWLGEEELGASRPLTAGVLVTQDGEVGVVTHGGWRLGGRREHVSGWLESDTTGASVEVNRVGREALRDTLRRSVGASASGAGHALRVWATSDEGVGTPGVDHGRGMLDASVRLGGHALWADASLRSEVATGDGFEHITDANLALGGRAGDLGALYVEGALAPTASVDVTRYPNGLTASSHATIGADVRAGLDVTGMWGQARHRLRPSLRAMVTPLRFGVTERSRRQDRLAGAFVGQTALASLRVDQEWSGDGWVLRAPVGAWAGAVDGEPDPTLGVQGGLEWTHPVIQARGDVFVEPPSDPGDEVVVRHDARVTLRPGRSHAFSVWSSDTTRRDVQRQRWVASPLGGIAAASSVDHLLEPRPGAFGARARHGVTWGLGSGARWWPRLDVDGYVAPWGEEPVEFGAAAGLNWIRRAEGVALGVKGAYSAIEGDTFVGVQAGLSWAL
jgi:hypothetical protein